MAIPKTLMEGNWFYDWKDIETKVQTHCGPCRFDILMDQCPSKLILRDNWMHQKSMLAFLKWYLNACETSYLSTVGAIERAIKEDLKYSRKMSRKYRWEVAYRQGYKCASCAELLHPKAMDIDHVQALHLGGEDIIANLQALCSNCHARKTRS